VEVGPVTPLTSAAELQELAAADKEQTSWQATDPSTPVAVAVVPEETGSTIRMAVTVVLE
jgi:hypothetical protein